MLVFTEAGRPVFSRYGDEDKLASFVGALTGMTHYIATNPCDGGGRGADDVACIATAGLDVVFLHKEQLKLVCISQTGEPVPCLRRQLELFYTQLVFILTAGVHKTLERKRNFDLRPLLGGTGEVLRALIHAGVWDPATLLVAFASLPLKVGARNALAKQMQQAAFPEFLYAVVFNDTHVVCTLRKKGFAVHADDVQVMLNFVRHNGSLRQAETFSPMCLPHFNPAGFLTGHVKYFSDSLCMVILASSNDCFAELSAMSVAVQDFLVRRELIVPLSGHAGELQMDLIPKQAGGGLAGQTALWHFLYKSRSHRQYVSPIWSPPIHAPKRRKAVMKTYQRLVNSINPTGQKARHRVEHRLLGDHMAYAFTAPEFELYAVFDPAIDKAQAVQICNNLCGWLHTEEANMFIAPYEVP